MTDLSEEQLAELIGSMPPAPPAWVRAAVELPLARAAIDQLVAQAIADRHARETILADLEAALRAANVEPRPQLIASLRERLSGFGE